MKKATSLEILNLIDGQNQEKAIQLIFRNFFPSIRANLLRKGAIKEDIEDLFQDAIFIFYKKCIKKELKKDTEIGSYLYTVTKNLWLNKVQRDTKSTEFRPDVFENKNIESPYKVLDNQERESRIKEIFAQLGARCEELLLSKFYLGLNMKEIVEKMGFKNEDSVKTQNYKCKQQLLSIAKEKPWIINLLKGVN